MCNAVRVTNNTLKTWMWKAKNQQGGDLTENHLTKLLLMIMKSKVEKGFSELSDSSRDWWLSYTSTRIFLLATPFSSWASGFTGDIFLTIFTRISYFSPGYNAKDIFTDVWSCWGCWTYERGSPMYNFLLGLSPPTYFFIEVEAGGALGKDVCEVL